MRTILPNKIYNSIDYFMVISISYTICNRFQNPRIILISTSEKSYPFPTSYFQAFVESVEYTVVGFADVLHSKWRTFYKFLEHTARVCFGSSINDYPFENLMILKQQ